MIKVVALYLLTSFFLAHAGESLLVENNGCVMEVRNSVGFSFMKVNEDISYIEYKYKDGRTEGVKISCKNMTLAEAISSDYVQEKDGLKLGVGTSPLSKAVLFSGQHLSGVEGVYFLGAVCFTTTFEAGSNHVFFIDTCGDEEDMKELRKRLLSLLKRAKTYYVETGTK